MDIGAQDDVAPSRPLISHVPDLAFAGAAVVCRQISDLLQISMGEDEDVSIVADNLEDPVFELFPAF